MNELKNAVNTPLTPGADADAPNQGPNGAPFGAGSQEPEIAQDGRASLPDVGQPAPLPEVRTPATAPPDAPTSRPDDVFARTPWLRPDPQAPLHEAQVTGEVGAFARSRFARNVRPTCDQWGKGTRPRCGVFLRLNFVARRHPINRLRRDQLLDQFVRDYQPDTQRLRSMCEQDASVVERAETMKAGSPEYKRLVELSERPHHWKNRAPIVSHSCPRVPCTLSDEEMLEKLLDMARQLLETRDAQHIASAVAGPVQTEVEPTPESTSVPAPEPCPYCHRACVWPTHFAYDVLHWDDPTEIKNATTAPRPRLYESVRRARRGEIPQW